MPVTNTYIQTAIEKGKEYSIQLLANYVDFRYKGKICNPVWVEIGTIEAFVKALEGHDADLTSGQCIDNFEVESIIDAMEKAIQRLSLNPVKLFTYFRRMDIHYSRRMVIIYYGYKK
jgi:hypothetical protein